MEIKNSYVVSKNTKLFCEDNWKFNMPHHFVVTDLNDNPVAKIDCQEGPILEAGVNGVSNEDLLSIVLTRLECAQKSEFRCRENEEAAVSIIDALNSLRSRTFKRMSAGKEGTSKV